MPTTASQTAVALTAAAAPDVAAAFTAAARDRPGRTAILHNGLPLTYAWLLGQAEAIAARLGPRPGVVAVRAAHTPETVAAMFGVWLAGGTYCPVDPAFPAARRQAMLTAAGCRVSLRDGHPVPVEDAPAESGDGAAYLLFTSGSTAQPRPVAVGRAAIAATVRSLRALFGVTSDDRVLQFASLNWDTCFEEILPTLTAGAALVLDGEAHTGSFPRFLRMVARAGVTVLDLPTAYWHELVNHLTEEGCGLPACVRLVIIGGEPVSPARLADWSGLDTGGVRLLNTYGCTETTLITHAVDLHGPLAPAWDTPWRHAAKAPIGHALPHVAERVTEQGELLIGGAGLADGYPGRPDLTGARFVHYGQRRYFHTGDRVSRLPGGALVHEGRLDHELKIRGVRVDPAEVEAHIATHPEVVAVAVAGLTAAGRTLLAAYVVPRAGADPATLGADIQAHLRTRVPPHLVPGRVAVVPELFHTASGKIDRRRTKEAYQ